MAQIIIRNPENSDYDIVVYQDALSSEFDCISHLEATVHEGQEREFNLSANLRFEIEQKPIAGAKPLEPDALWHERAKSARSRALNNANEYSPQLERI
jgi:hypothetical protein